MGMVPDAVLPKFATNEILAGTKYEWRADLSFKRNFSLLFSLLSGWQRIFFLDDDVTVPLAGDIGAAAGLLDEHLIVGLRFKGRQEGFPEGFPDNSVVCHASREVGRPQDTFIGGGALAVDVRRCESFFPNIYNEDWFFLLDDVQARHPAVVGEALQKKYDPFDDRSRARSQEFGDCLAEGLYALLDMGSRVSDVREEYWVNFLAARESFIGEIIDAAAVTERRTRAGRNMARALRAARARCRTIDPRFCCAYLDAWRVDRRSWRNYINSVAACADRGECGLNPERALFELGLNDVSTYVSRDGPARSSEMSAVPLS
jgi:hypothetical protein